MAKIIKQDERAITEHKICACCEHLLCTGYIYPRCRMLCARGLPKWEWLFFLMRNVGPSYTCKKFQYSKALAELQNKK